LDEGMAMAYPEGEQGPCSTKSEQVLPLAENATKLFSAVALPWTPLRRLRCSA